MSRKRLIFIMALTVSAVVAVVPSAQASHGDDTFAPTVCNLLPGVAGSAANAGANGVNNVLPAGSGADDATFGGAWDPLQLLDTDPGEFTFSGDAVCTGLDIASEAGNPAPQVAAAPVSITAAGDFDNLICGTGTANGDAKLVGTTLDGLPIQIYTEFGITFVGGKGVLSFVVDADDAGAPVGGQEPSAPDGKEARLVYGGHSFIGDNQVDGGNGAGAISITPQTGNCATTPVSSFTVHGAFGGVISGEGSDVSTRPGSTDSDN